MTSPMNARRRFVKAAMEAPYLGREEEHDLAVRWRDGRDEAALHRLTAAHMRLVIALAARFKHFGLPASDLIQEGHVGLLEAAARFEPAREVRFSTYATWWIRAAIQDYVLRNWSIVRGGTSSSQKALFFNLRRLRAKLARGTSDLTETEMFTEIANAVGVSRADVEAMNARLSAPDTSLNAPLSEADGGGSDRQDFLVADAPLQDEMVGEQIDGERRTIWLRGALKVLSERELRIVRERRLEDDGATLEALGEKLGISKERVRQIENRALEKLKVALLRQQPDHAAFV
ncbi:RNA polymerase factor sigma-32 [Methyloraptor flagellatus]|uniref:RNA polymerase factor sigma-32 n=1 Tax=Methyloraptor flagellatus TaxID=3162530 RepID=A0AAU7XC51_9HYPH